MANKIKINFLYSSIYQLLLIILPLITAPYVSRLFGGEGVGVYSYTYSVASCFSMFGMLGVANYGNRVIAANRDNKVAISELFSDIWIIQIVMTCITILAYALYIFLYANPIYRGALFIQTLTVLCSCVDISWFFFGLEEFKLTVVRNLVIKCITTLSIFVFVNTKSDLLIYISILCGGTILGNLSLFPFLKIHIYFANPSLKRMKQHLPSLLMLFVPVLAVTLYKRMDKIMLGLMSTMSQTGYYENAEKIINIPMGLITALGTVMMPRMSYLMERGEERQVDYYMKISVEFTFFLASALMFGIASVSKEFVPLFYGVEFSSVTEIMQVLSLTILFVSLANIFRAQYLIPKHYDKVYIISVWGGALFNLIFNYILIPSNAGVGAAYATVLAEFAVMVIQMTYMWKELPILKYIKSGIYYLLAGIMMFNVVRFAAKFLTGWKGLFLEIIIGAVIYLMISTPYVLIVHKEYIEKIIGRKNKSCK